MTRRRSATLAAIGLAVGLLAAPVLSLPASAHDSLETADPTENSTVSTLDAVTLTFGSDLMGGDGANVIQVKGPDGRYYETGCPTLAGPDVSTPVTLGPAGTYQVLWRIVSSDGHPVSDEYRFTYQPAATTAPTAGSATPKCGDAATETGDAGAPKATSVWIGLGVGAIAVTGVAIAVWLIIRKPSTSD